jgi:hypothetical protein
MPRKDLNAQNMPGKDVKCMAYHENNVCMHGREHGKPHKTMDI